VSDYEGEDRRSRRDEPWHLKKEINLSLIIVLLGQLGMGVWYVSDFNAWRRDAERQLQRHEVEITAGEANTNALANVLADRLGRIETKIDNLMQKQ